MEMRNDSCGIDIPSTETRIQLNVVPVATDTVNAGRSVYVRAVRLDLNNPLVSNGRTALLETIAQRLRQLGVRC